MLLCKLVQGLLNLIGQLAYVLTCAQRLEAQAPEDRRCRDECGTLCSYTMEGGAGSGGEREAERKKGILDGAMVLQVALGCCSDHC